MLIFIVLLLAAALAGVLFLELNYPAAPVTVALRQWQAGLGSLIGLLGIALSVAAQAHEADRLERARIYREGLAIALSMQQEAFDVTRWLSSIEKLRARYEIKGDGSNKSDPMIICQLLFESARGARYLYSPSGIIESYRASVGKLPNLLGIHFLDLVAQQRHLAERIAAITDEDCKQDAQLQFDVLAEDIANVRTALGRIEVHMKDLPETTKVSVEY